MAEPGSTDSRGASPPWAAHLADRPGSKGPALRLPVRSTIYGTHDNEASTDDRRITTRALWAGAGVTLRGEGSVEIALHPGGYVRLGDAYVLVAAPRAPRGPLSLLVAGLEERPLAPGDRAWVDDELHVGGHDVALVEASKPSPAGPLRPGWRAALNAALESVPGPPAEIAGGIAALRARDVERAVAELAGRGEGLTPAGDDVLAGYAAWRCAAGDDPALAALAAGRASPIGLAYLRCAERGELPDVAARVVAAIRAGDSELARRRARALSAWGASSGAAMLWGVASAT